MKTVIEILNTILYTFPSGNFRLFHALGMICVIGLVLVMIHEFFSPRD